MIGNDIEKLIEAHTEKLNMYNTEKEYLLKGLLKGPSGYKPIDYSGLPHGSGGTYTLDREWGKLQEIQNKIDIEIWAIEKYKNQLNGLKETIVGIKGVDAQLRYLRDIEGLSLQEIADKTKYDLGYIKQVSARNPRKKRAKC